MSDLNDAINQIIAVEADIGLAELAREADVPYTTAVDWKAKGWRPKTIATFERLVGAAARRAQPSEAA